MSKPLTLTKFHYMFLLMISVFFMLSPVYAQTQDEIQNRCREALNQAIQQYNVKESYLVPQTLTINEDMCDCLDKLPYDEDLKVYKVLIQSLDQNDRDDDVNVVLTRLQNKFPGSDINQLLNSVQIIY